MFDLTKGFIVHFRVLVQEQRTMKNKNSWKGWKEAKGWKYLSLRTNNSFYCWIL